MPVLSMPTPNQNRGATEFFCNNVGFAAFPDTTQTTTAVAMPAEEALENTTIYDYGSYQQGFQSYAEADYMSSRGQEGQVPQERDQYQPPTALSEAPNEQGDDFRYMMPEFFVASIQQRYCPSGPPPGDPEVVGTGEGAPDPADCL